MPSGKPISVPRSHGFHERRHSSRFHAGASRERDGCRLVAAVLPRLVQRFADGEQADHEDHDVDAVEQLRNAEREARVARQRVDADQSQGQSQEQAEQAAHEARAGAGQVTAANASTVSAK